MALAIADHPEVSYFYSDEDKLDADGRRFSPFFKPDFDPAMLLGENYPCHLFVARREAIEEAGGFRAGFEGGRDWDLLLRITERLDPTGRHIPRSYTTRPRAPRGRRRLQDQPSRTQRWPVPAPSRSTWPGPVRPVR